MPHPGAQASRLAARFGALRADVVIPGHNSPLGLGINPAISGDGRWVAFESWMDLTGGNPDGNWEIFLWDSQLGILSQITDGGGGSPALDGDGSRVAFLANGDFVPGGNPDRSQEIFVYDVPARRFIQATHTVGVFHGAPAIDAAGSRIAFSSSADLVPGRNPQHVYQIFLFDVDLRAIRQVTAIAAGAGAGVPSLSADGSRIAFQSRGDLIPGSNPEGNSEIFLATCPAAELSLHGGRFRVSAEWRLPGQAAVRATGVKLSELAGYFWFFHPDNPELFVKVLDACPQNFWVFCAGLTDIEVGLRVVDTESGEERVWTSVGGQPFPIIQDTLHFRVCDE
jgi:hypothetical protein